MRRIPAPLLVLVLFGSSAFAESLVTLRVGEQDSCDLTGVTWEMTVYVIPSCIRSDCTVDVTPRHCKAFKARPGEKFRYTNTSLADGKTVRAGELAADRWGLVTVEGVTVSKGKNRISIVRR